MVAPAIDKTNFSESGAITPAGSAIEVTPADADISSTSFTRAIYVGTTGTVIVTMAADDAVITFANVQAGSVLPIRVSQVNLGTTASDIVALY